MSLKKTVPFIFLGVLLLKHSEGAGITINATSEILTGSDSLTVRCTPTVTGLSEINSIQILRNGSGKNMQFQTLVTVSYNRTTSSSQIDWRDKELQGRAGVAAFGSVTTLTSSYLFMNVTGDQTKCQDAGSYRCEMAATTSTGNTLTPVPQDDAEVKLRDGSDCNPDFSGNTAFSTHNPIAILTSGLVVIIGLFIGVMIQFLET